MASVDRIAAIETDLDKQISSADSLKAELAAKKETIGLLKSDIAAELVVAHDAGFDEGVKQSSAPGEKQFSLEEMNAEIKIREDKILEKDAALNAKGLELEAAQARVKELESAAPGGPAPVDTTPFDQAAMDAFAADRVEKQQAADAEVLTKAQADAEAKIADLTKQLKAKDADAIQEAVADQLEAIVKSLRDATIPEVVPPVVEQPPVVAP